MFEKYLEEYWAENIAEGVLDDDIDMEVEFELWIINLDVDDVIELADKFGEHVHEETMKGVEDALKTNKD